MARTGPAALRIPRPARSFRRCQGDDFDRPARPRTLAGRPRRRGRRLYRQARRPCRRRPGTRQSPVRGCRMAGPGRAASRLPRARRPARSGAARDFRHTQRLRKLAAERTAEVAAYIAALNDRVTAARKRGDHPFDDPAWRELAERHPDFLARPDLPEDARDALSASQRDATAGRPGKPPKTAAPEERAPAAARKGLMRNMVDAVHGIIARRGGIGTRLKVSPARPRPPTPDGTSPGPRPAASRRRPARPRRRTTASTCSTASGRGSPATTRK